MRRIVFRLSLYIFIIVAVQNIFAKHFDKATNSSVNLSITPCETHDSSYTNSENLLEQNYPNPFNPTTTITFKLPERSYVELNIYNVLGVKLTTLVKGVKEVGTYSVRFDASNYPSGLYIYELQTGNYKQIKKMIYMK